jgi:hydroxyacylglutathione hydrolase
MPYAGVYAGPLFALSDWGGAVGTPLRRCAARAATWEDPRMIVERSLNERFLSNTYLVADGEGGPGFFVDAGGPVTPLVAVAERLGIEPTHVLLTHHHFDHVSELGELRKRWPKLRVLIHPLERDLLAGLGDVAGTAEELGVLEAGEPLRFGLLEVRPLKTPGHTAGMLSFLVSDSALPHPLAPPTRNTRPGAGSGPGGFQGGEAVVFTGDTLFKGSVGGVRAPGHTTYTDLRDSIMGTLMELPPDTIIYPGHTDATSVAREWQENAFIRVWRGLDPEGSDPCTALGEPATLILLGDDYDGGKKAWVRWPDGSDDIVPGSRVEVTA